MAGDSTVFLHAANGKCIVFFQDDRILNTVYLIIFVSYIEQINIHLFQTMSYFVVVSISTHLGVRTSRQSLVTLRASETWTVPILSQRSYFFGQKGKRTGYQTYWIKACFVFQKGYQKLYLILEQLSSNFEMLLSIPRFYSLFYRSIWLKRAALNLINNKDLIYKVHQV